VYEILPFCPGTVVSPALPIRRSKSAATTGAVLDSQMFPHIFETIVGYAGYEALVALRGASRALKAVADARIAGYYAEDIATCKLRLEPADGREGSPAAVCQGCDGASAPSPLTTDALWWARGARGPSAALGARWAVGARDVGVREVRGGELAAK
jgi:hypothetical protein